MFKKTLILLAFIVSTLACKQPSVDGIITDKVYREKYETRELECHLIGKVNSCRYRTVYHSEKWIFLLKMCDKHNNCDYNEWEVPEDIYNCYEIGIYFNSEVLSCPQ